MATPDPNINAIGDAPGNPRQDETGLIEAEQRVVKWWHPLAMVLLLAGLFLLFDATGIGSDLRRGDLATLRLRIESFGTLAPLVFFAVYTIATMLAFPASPLTFVAGALFGILEGTLLALAASTVTTILSFLIARHLARGHVHRWLQHNRRFQQLDHLTRHHGPQVVLITRLINILPFFMVNYGLGLTRVPWKTYAIWSFIGRLPGLLILVLLGDAVYQSLFTGDVPWLMVSLMFAILAGLAALIRHLNRQLKQYETSAPPRDTNPD